MIIQVVFSYRGAGVRLHFRIMFFSVLWTIPLLDVQEKQMEFNNFVSRVQEFVEIVANYFETSEPAR